MKQILILLFFSNLAFATKKTAYPEHWWAYVDPKTAPEWEILPQDASPHEVILSKRNELGILSNFSKSPFELDGQKYLSLEGFWQMMKFPENSNDERIKPGIEWPMTREFVSGLIGFEAKDAGGIGSKNMEKLKINWVSYLGKKMDYRISEKLDHYQLIVRATKAKVEQNLQVKEILISTGDLKLRPDHKQSLDTPPAWKYFEILQEIRESLKVKK